MMPVSFSSSLRSVFLTIFISVQNGRCERIPKSDVTIPSSEHTTRQVLADRHSHQTSWPGIHSKYVPQAWFADHHPASRREFASPQVYPFEHCRSVSHRPCRNNVVCPATTRTNSATHRLSAT